ILLIIIILIICRTYVVFLILLSMGPVPLSLMISPETRSTGIGWIKSVFSKFMTLFMYSVILKISHRFIVEHQYDIYEKAGGIVGLFSNFVPAILMIFMVLFLFKITGDLTESLVN
ncbi:MAG: type IV secretion system protein, partial [Candidatus Aminicenantes bacterium]|nr:type IV secretion system protein [Candidatus Aminicenantes bacterium]